MALKFVLAGIGGQGVIYATKVLAQAGLLGGLPIMASENHGMSQRGGSVISHLKIGGSQAPLIRRGTAEALIAFDRQEAVRNLSFVRAGGRVYVNAPAPLAAALNARLADLGIGVYCLDASAAAQALGASAPINLVLLGFAAANGLGLELASLKEAVQLLGPQWAVAANWQGLEAGAAQHATV
ncbi:MAG: 2-oxoacid:acceptor oxidoreductase family protein [Anaerolineales bacterium]|nr:2-oxoacid:acceptor oxidoreductase family protein [Anaerolineales bacterium]